jgi:hypothetical protein
MKYEYWITAWKNGSPVKSITSVNSKKEAMKIANKLIAGHYGFSCDAVDVDELSVDEWKMHSKTAFTLINRKWEKGYTYIGEDE